LDEKIVTTSGSNDHTTAAATFGLRLGEINVQGPAVKLGAIQRVDGRFGLRRVDISTKAKPRERPVSRSVTRLARSTVPYASKRERIDDSVAPKLKLPTKILVKVYPYDD